MPPKEPTRAQLSSRLAYQSHRPAFLQKLENRMAGKPDESEEEDEEFEYVGNGRAPIPKRPRDKPPIPERPKNEPCSADEDGGDEAPQIVVLREGKHLTAREVENIKRKEKGLAPLPEHDDDVQKSELEADAKSSKKQDSIGQNSKNQGLSFSSSSKTASTSKAKRKAAALLGDSEARDDTSQTKAPSKKKKKQDKKLLSFGDDA